LSDIDQISRFSTDFYKNNQYQIPRKFSGIRADKDGQTGGHDESKRRFSGQCDLINNDLERIWQETVQADLK
jgi:hypothetical protein